MRILFVLIFIIAIFVPIFTAGKVFAVTITGGSCTADTATRTCGGSFNTTDTCSNNLTWQNCCYTGTDTSNNPCTFCQDECTSANCQNKCAPPPTCTSSLLDSSCAYPRFTPVGCSGTGVFCSGLHQNSSCRYCQGWSKRSCQSDGSCIEVPCSYEGESGCGTVNACNPNPCPQPAPICTYPDPSTVSCGQTVNATNGPNCSNTQSLKGTACPTGKICSNDVCVDPCPSGSTVNCLAYSCQTGSCPAGTNPSAKGCSTSGQVCCYSYNTAVCPAGPPACTCSSASQVPCNLPISTYSDCPSCTGTGTYCSQAGYTCTASGCQSSTTTTGGGGTPPGGTAYCTLTSAQATGPNSGSASVSYSGFNRIQWSLNGVPDHHTQVPPDSTTFINLTTNQTYNITAQGWCDTANIPPSDPTYCTSPSVNCNGSFSIIPTTTATPPPTTATPPPTSTTLTCSRCGSDRGYWTDRASCCSPANGSCTYSCPSTCSSIGANDSSQNHLAGVCWIEPGPPPPVVQTGRVSGRIFLKDTPTSTPKLVDRLNTDGPQVSVGDSNIGLSEFWPLQMWLYNSPSDTNYCDLFDTITISGVPNVNRVCTITRTIADGTDNAHSLHFSSGGWAFGFGSYESSGPQWMGTDGRGLILQLYRWPDKWTPVAKRVWQEKRADDTGSSSCGTCHTEDCSGGRATSLSNCTVGGDCGCGVGQYCGANDCHTSYGPSYCGRPGDGDINDGQTPVTYNESPLTNLIQGQLNTIEPFSCQPDRNPYSVHAVVDLVFEKAPPPPASTFTISGSARIDTNSNYCQIGATLATGAQAPTIKLSAGPTTKADTNTQTNGTYSFSALSAGTYTIKAIPTSASDRSSAISRNVGPDAPNTDFCITPLTPWLKTTGGDIYSGTSINLPNAPTPSELER